MKSVCYRSYDTLLSMHENGRRLVYEQDVSQLERAMSLVKEGTAMFSRS